MSTFPLLKITHPDKHRREPTHTRKLQSAVPLYACVEIVERAYQESAKIRKKQFETRFVRYRRKRRGSTSNSNRKVTPTN